jgi:hypothetical protein
LNPIFSLRRIFSVHLVASRDMLRTTSRPALTRSNQSRTNSNTTSTSTIIRKPANPRQTSTPASSLRSLLNQPYRFPVAAPSTTSPPPHQTLTSQAFPPLPSLPSPAARARLSADDGDGDGDDVDDDFVTDSATDDADLATDGGEDDTDPYNDNHNDDHLSFEEWLDKRKKKKCHYLTQTRYELLVTIAEKGPKWLSENRSVKQSAK